MPNDWVMVRVPQDVRDLIRALADATGLSMGDVVGALASGATPDRVLRARAAALKGGAS